MLKVFQFILLIFPFVAAFSQTPDSLSADVGIGQWRIHVPYNKAKVIEDDGVKIYCVTKGDLFSYSRADNSFERLSKISGLSGVGVSTIAYHSDKKILLVAYEDANIDLIENEKILNIPDIKLKPILGLKTINNIFFSGDLAYLSCGFGIVVVDLNKKEIKDTYLIGPNGIQIKVFDFCSNGSLFFAATEKGVYTAPVGNQFLSDYAVWTLQTQLPSGVFNTVEFAFGKVYAGFSKKLTSNVDNQDAIYVYDGSWQIFPKNINYNILSIRFKNNQLVATFKGVVFVFYNSALDDYYVNVYFGETANPQDGFTDKDGNLWIADLGRGLIKRTNDNKFEKYFPNGPTSVVSTMNIRSGHFWAVPGGNNESSWINSYNTEGVSHFTENHWDIVNREDSKAIDTLHDVIAVACDPKDPNHAFIGSWRAGVAEIQGSDIVQVYNTHNSTLQRRPEYHWVGIGGLVFDNENNLWATNPFATNPLSMRKPDGTWKSFNLSALFTDYPQIKEISKIIVTSTGSKWMVQPKSQGIIAFKDNGTYDDATDDDAVHLESIVGKGGLPTNNVYYIAEDQNGEIWVGTGKGVVVFYNPESVFSSSIVDAKPITLEQDGYVQHLLETESVTAIVVDGSNRKWLGTAGSGVYLMSADGTNEINHFTEENSPLLDNKILDIAIDQTTGEVYFATNKGIVSYKGTATAGGKKCSNNVYAYPNPIKENYSGPIAINGLINNSEIKITDISGSLVFKGFSEGGQAIWDGNNPQGEKVHTGVYLIFSADKEGKSSCVSKVLVVNNK